jgi:hypothetical protein
MEALLVSMKYQVKAEQVRMRMRLKNATNLVRRLTNLAVRPAGDSGDTCGN